MTPDDLKRAGVRVRPLAWVQRDNVETFDAIGADLSYRVDDAFNYFASDGVRTQLPSWRGPFTSTQVCVSLEAAKAAAQQDYENRILSALEPIHE